MDCCDLVVCRPSEKRTPGKAAWIQVDLAGVLCHGPERFTATSVLVRLPLRWWSCSTGFLSCVLAHRIRILCHMTNRFPEETRPLGPLCLRDSQTSVLVRLPLRRLRGECSPGRPCASYCVGNDDSIVVGRGVASSGCLATTGVTLIGRFHLKVWDGTIVFHVHRVERCRAADSTSGNEGIEQP